MANSGSGKLPEDEQVHQTVAVPVSAGKYAESTVARLAALTPTEMLMLRLVAQGFTDRSIAERRQVSLNTVKYHIKGLLQKTGCSRRTELVALAFRAGVM